MAHVISEVLFASSCVPLAVLTQKKKNGTKKNKHGWWTLYLVLRIQDVEWQVSEADSVEICTSWGF